jgi:putative ABC transport system substrate-binding protein
LALALSAGCDDQSNPKFPIIGIVQFASTSSLDQLRTGVVRGLEQAGVRDRGNVRIIYGNGNGDAGQTSATLQNIAAQSPAVIVVIGTQTANASNAIRASVPIVFCGVVDPVLAGIADTPTQAKTNVTGVSNPFAIDAGVRLVKEILPAVTKMGSLADPAEPFAAGFTTSAQAQATTSGATFTVQNIATTADVTNGVNSLKTAGVQAVLQFPSNTVNQGFANQLAACQAQNLPLFSVQVDQVALGVVAAIGIDLEAAGAQAGGLTAQVLRGTSPNSIPMQTAQKSLLYANTAAATRFGITIPNAVLSRADKVITN